VSDCESNCESDCESNSVEAIVFRKEYIMLLYFFRIDIMLSKCQE